MSLPKTLKTPPEIENFKAVSSTPEAIEAAKDWLKTCARSSEATTFAGFGKKGEFLGKVTGVCHAGAIGIGKTEESRSVFATTCGKPGTKDKKVYGPFLDWFLNDSPFSFLILNKDDPDFCLEHGFIFSYDAPRELFHGACIVSRHFLECTPLSFKIFNDLVENKNIHPIIAFNFCFCSNLSNSKRKNVLPKTWFLVQSNHRIGLPFSVESLVNIFLGLLVYTSGFTYKQSPSIRGCSRLWRSSSDTAFYFNIREKNKDLDKLILNFREKQGYIPVYSPPNPFVKMVEFSHNEIQKRQKERNFTLEEMIEIVIPYIQEKVFERLEQNVSKN